MSLFNNLFIYTSLNKTNYNLVGLRTKLKKIIKEQTK
jgi:hypothetical protein